MQSFTDDLYKYITDLSQHTYWMDPPGFILMILLEIEVREPGYGFRYLQTAILLLYRHPELLITKGIYPAVASQCATNASAEGVEHSIRNTLRASWTRHNDLRDVLFPSGKCPSNGDFIARMAKLVELWERCCKAYQQKCKEVAHNEA